MQHKLSELLSKQEYICVTCDVWSSRAQAYLGMSVHFINDNFERESFVLAFRQLKYKQTNVVMATEMTKVLKEYGIDVEKVTNIVTDRRWKQASKIACSSKQQVDLSSSK